MVGLFGAPSESLFEGGFNFNPSAGGAWAMSPQDRFMAVMQGLSSAGSRMAHHGGQGGWKDFALGMGGLTEGIQKGGQQALVQRLLGQRYEDAQKKAERERREQESREAFIATLPPEQQALARANSAKYVDTSIDNSIPKAPAPRQIGDLQTIQDGPTKKFQRWNGTAWEDVGQGPAFAPHAPQKPHEFESKLLAAGLRPGTPQYQAAVKAMLPQGNEGSFGNSEEGRAKEILLNPQSDPNSERYAMAYWQMTQPKPMEMVREDGSKAVQWIVPTLPPNIRRPGYAQQQAAATAPPGAPGAQPPAGDAPAAAPPQQAAPGMPTLVPAGPQQPPKMNDEQAKAAGFVDRMRASEPIIEKYKAAGTSFVDQQAAKAGDLGSFITSDDFKMLDQAKRDFINAALRRESGAVISPEEFDNANKQYFPQPNDPPPLLEQKRKNRQVTMEGIARAAGPAYKPVAPDKPAEAPKPMGAQPKEGDIIRNKNTGERRIYQGGKWVTIPKDGATP